MLRQSFQVLVTVIACGATLPALGDETSSNTAYYLDKLNWNVPMRTLGGKQLWTDHLIHGKWRIQQNVLTGHYRLLDPKNSRQASGSWENCLQQWKQIKEDRQIGPLRRRVVIVMHGLIRTRKSMEGIAEYLEQQSDYSVLNFSYSSTRAEVKDHAKALGDVVRHLQGVDEISFVAHSLGNLVIRHYLGDQMAASKEHRIDHRNKRIVMLAPPNNGTQLAERLRKNPVFRVVFGVSGVQLAEKWGQLEGRLPVPPCQFGIIAGNGMQTSGDNPLLDGNDDFVVSVEETRLPGAHDFVIVPGLHSFIMDQVDVREYTLRFLREGYFVSAEKRNPIPVAAPDATKSP